MLGYEDGEYSTEKAIQALCDKNDRLEIISEKHKLDKTMPKDIVYIVKL